jgi:hypothetical protein
MLKTTIYTILLSTLVVCGASCSSKIISTKYYYQHEKDLDKIEDSYQILYPQKPFTVAFTNKTFKTILLEIITDTLSYVYEFEVDEPRLMDTLTRHHLNATAVHSLIKEMQSIKCSWINKFDYYVDQKKNSLVYMSIKRVSFHLPISYPKYYILTYFPQPQYFDSSGQLLDKRHLNRLRKINGDIFRRINNKVCYTVSGNFR